MPVIVIDPDSDLTRPRIAWNNLFLDSGATVTTDSEDADYPHQQALDWLPHTHWMPASTGAHYIRASFASAKTVNYFAFCSHDIHTNSGTIKLQKSADGTTWTDVASATPITGAPVYMTFDDVSSQHWRVLMNSVTPSKLGVVAFGEDMTLERGCWIGFTPPELGRDTDLTTTVSDNGTFLGRSVIRELWSSALDLDFLSFGWVYESWLPFVKHAELKPFFLKWHEVRYPNAAAFCWSMKRGDIKKPEISKREMMSTGIRFQCVTE